MDQRVSREQTPGLAPAGASRPRALLRLGAIIAIVALVLLAWVVDARHRAEAALSRQTETDEVLVVATAQPRPDAAATTLVLPGNLQADYEAPIYARTSGYLRRWYVDIGATVRKGQLLAEIEAPEVDQQLRQAEADLAVAKANQKIADLTAERWRRLRATDSVSRQEADQKVSAAQASDAQAQAARANVLRLRELSGFEHITAPFDGIVTARNTDIGQLINAGSGSGAALFRIADVKRLRLYVQVPQEDAPDMKPGLKAALHVPDRPGAAYEATLAATARAIDPGTRTLTVELMIDNTQNRLLPGAYAEVHFQLPASDARHSFLLPANVLLFRGDGLHVATVDGRNHVVLKPVAVGRDYGSRIEIVSGLSADDRVILSPPDSLVNGDVVRVVKRHGPEA